MSSQVETEATVVTPLEDWKNADWRKLEQRVFRLQKRIYRAERRGNVKAVHSLQRLLEKSWAARMLAVRRVTQDNQGKKTAGLDGVKFVAPKDRLAMVELLAQPEHINARPVRRVQIPKRGKPGATRLLGIPIMLDRAHQALVKLTLEPQWEARFEPNSYGFRPGRSCHDAIDALHSMICYKPKYVLDADIEGCFDNIDHQALLNKLDAPPALRRVIRTWLQAGVMEGLNFSPTTTGTPHGGVISPLLANIALHGLEEVVARSCRKRVYYEVTERSTCGVRSNMLFTPRLVRYADDFVIIFDDLEGITAAREATEQFLDDMGLHLNQEKTRITHTLDKHQGNVGFDFLGFHIRQHRVGKYSTGKHRDQPLGTKTLIKPSKDAIKRHVRQIGDTITAMRPSTQDQLVVALSPVITGWARYYRTVAATETFTTIDHHIHGQLWRWGWWRHKNKSKGWRFQKYWAAHPPRQWAFTSERGKTLPLHKDTHIVRHAKVKGDASPYDGNLVYWTKRLTTHPMNRTAEAKLLQRQHGRCVECGLHFTDEDCMEIDHINPNGGEKITNKQLLHRHCHDKKTVRMGDHRHRQQRNPS